jgi:hypothetical protein
MTHPQGRHHAARPQGSRRSVGLPRPGQALLGFHPPEPSLFGVPQPRLSEADRPIGSGHQPPRPRIAPDDWPTVPRPPSHKRNWLTLIGIPLAVVTLGVALGVIAVVMLVAAGVPAPWGN